MIRFNQLIMSSFKSFLTASLVLLVSSFAFPSIDAGKITILDDAGESADIETIALAVCEKLTGTSKQIALISTIPKLADYLRGATSPDHKLYGCSQKYLNSLVDLVEVLDSANDNVCGDQKLKLIEDFHEKYVSKVKKHVKNQKRHSKVPKVAKLFFMQYVSEISSRCEQAAVEMLAKREHKISEKELESMNKLKAFTDALGMSDLSKGYEGIHLMWNMVDSLPLEEDEKFSQYLEERGSSARLNVQFSDPRHFVIVQTLCRIKMRPVYSNSILPVLRLTDLGYYPQGENQLARDFQDPKSAAHSLLMATQICETILPMRAYQDQQLKPNQIVALTKEEAAQLTPLEIPKEVKEELAKASEKLPVEASKEASMVGLDRLPAVHAGEARERVDMIKSALESRSNIMMRMLRMSMKTMKSKIKSSLGSYLLSKKNQRSLMDETALEKIDLDQETPADELRRRRRDLSSKDPKRTSTWANIKRIGKRIGLIIAQLLLWLFQFTVVLSAIIITFLFFILTAGSKIFAPVFKGLFYLWDYQIPIMDYLE